MKNTIPKVPAGITTVTGYGVSLTAFVLAIIAFLTGDHSEQTIGTVVAGAVGLLTLLATQIGRYGQARALAANWYPHMNVPEVPSPPEPAPDLDEPDEPGDVLDGLPDIPAVHREAPDHLGDPMTRGEVVALDGGTQ